MERPPHNTTAELLSPEVEFLESEPPLPQPSCLPSGAELCDNIDNDCDGQIDEDRPGFQFACEEPCEALVFGECEGCIDWEHATGVDVSGGGFREPITNRCGGLALTGYPNASLWLPQHDQGTVTKLDPLFLADEGRFVTNAAQPESHPLHTVADLENRYVWVGHEGAEVGGVTKIANWSSACEEELERCPCVDKNGDGRITTSRDLNDDGEIAGDEFVGAGDECLLGHALRSVSVGALAMDPSGVLWVGDAARRGFHKLNAETMEVGGFVSVGVTPQEALIDDNGVLWASEACCGGSGAMQWVDTTGDNTPHAATVSGGHGVGPRVEQPWEDAGYGGISIDARGRLWRASYPRTDWIAARFDPYSDGDGDLSTGEWVRVMASSKAHSGNGYGISVSRRNPRGTVWVSQRGAASGGRLTGFDPDTLKVVKDTNVTEFCPVPAGLHVLRGIAWAADGFVLMSCQATEQAQAGSLFFQGGSPVGAIEGTIPLTGDSPSYGSLFPESPSITRTTTVPFSQTCPSGNTGQWRSATWEAIIPGGARLEVQFRESAASREALGSMPWKTALVQTESGERTQMLDGVGELPWAAVRFVLTSNTSWQSPEVVGLGVERSCD